MVLDEVEGRDFAAAEEHNFAEELIVHNPLLLELAWVVVVALAPLMASLLIQTLQATEPYWCLVLLMLDHREVA